MHTSNTTPAPRSHPLPLPTPTLPPPFRILEENLAEPDSSRWLPGACLNIAHCALTSPLAPAECPAIIWAQEGSPQQLQRVSRQELRRRAGHVAACLRCRFEPGALQPLALERVTGATDRACRGALLLRKGKPAPCIVLPVQHVHKGAHHMAAAGLQVRMCSSFVH